MWWNRPGRLHIGSYTGKSTLQCVRMPNRTSARDVTTLAMLQLRKPETSIAIDCRHDCDVMVLQGSTSLGNCIFMIQGYPWVIKRVLWFMIGTGKCNTHRGERISALWLFWRGWFESIWCVLWIWKFYFNSYPIYISFMILMFYSKGLHAISAKNWVVVSADWPFSDLIVGVIYTPQ